MIRTKKIVEAISGSWHCVIAPIVSQQTESFFRDFGKILLWNQFIVIISNLKMVTTDTLVNDFSPETGFLLLF